MLKTPAVRKAFVFFDQIKKSAVLNILINIVNSLGLGFASYFFKTQGLEFYKIMLVWAIVPLASLPILAFVNKWDTRRFLKIGLLAYVGMSLSLIFYNQFSYITFSVLNGIAYGFFWPSLNYVFFSASSKDRHAKDWSVYFLLAPLVGTIMPPLGALIIGNFGFKALFMATTALTFLPLFYVKDAYFDHVSATTFSKASKQFSGLKLIVFFNYALHFFQGSFLAIYLLLFLKTEYAVGGLLSYLALLSLLVSFLLSYASDRFNKRVEFLYPLMTLMAISTIIMPQIKNLSYLIPLIGIYAVLDNLSLPIRFAVHTDVGVKDMGFWRVSDFYGNLGRIIVFAISALLFYLGNYTLPFILFAVMSFVLPFIIRYKINRLAPSGKT